MTDLANALQVKAATPAEKTIYDLVEAQGPELAKLLPAHVTAERFQRIVWTEIRRTPKLLECSPASLLGAMLLSAQLGLEPGPLGHVYLVPFKGSVEFIVGYKGFIDLAFRSGQVKDIATGTVYEGDGFEWREGTRPFLDHTPAGPPGEREATHWYAVGRLKSGGAPFRVLYPEDVEKAKKRSASGSKGLGPWVSDFDAMARKTAVRRLAGLLPMSPVFASGIEQDDLPAPAFGEVAPVVELEGETDG